MKIIDVTTHVIRLRPPEAYLGARPPRLTTGRWRRATRSASTSRWRLTAPPVAPHHSVGLGIAVSAGPHVRAAIGNVPAFEFRLGTMAVASRIRTAPIPGRPVSFPVPSAPGLGIEVDLPLEDS